MTDPSLESSPFSVLGIGPTLDLARIKRAYFSALAEHPPHADPRGFRLIRDAYESLRGEGLRAAYLAAPFDLGVETTALGDELGTARAHAVAHARAALRRVAKVAAFEALFELSLEDALMALTPSRDPAAGGEHQ